MAEPRNASTTHDDAPMASYAKREYARHPSSIEFVSEDAAVVAAQIRRRPCVGVPHDRPKLHVEGRHAQMVRVQKVLNSIWKAERDAKGEEDASTVD